MPVETPTSPEALESFEWIKPREYASLMRVPVKTVYRLIRNGKISAVKVGKQSRIPRPTRADAVAQPASQHLSAGE